MSFLSGLVGLLGFVCLLVALIGLISPSVFKDRKTGDIPKRRELLIGGLLASVMAFMVAGWLAPDAGQATPVAASTSVADTTEKANHGKVPNATTQTPDSQLAPEKSLGVTPEAFRQAFNHIVLKISSDYKLAELDVKQGTVNNTFQRSLGNNVGLVGTVDKTSGQLKELMVILAGSKTSDDMLRPVVVLLSATQALNTSVAKEENSKVVIAMTKQALADIKMGTPIERTVGKLHYTAAAREQMGLMSSISPR